MIRRPMAWVLLVSTMLFSTPARAADLPDGYQPVAGSSSYSVSGDGLTGTLTASDPVTIGNWSAGFNVASGHTFEALLPAGGAHLSRDITASPSQIFGALNVPQGRFFLVNTSGVYFAPGSQVNVAGLVASTLDIQDADFLAGNYHFVQGAGPAFLSNKGTITATEGVALIGGAVENRGLIVAQEGSVTLASGKEMTLSFDPQGMISVAVGAQIDAAVHDKDGALVKSGVLNKGVIRADGGKVLLTAEALDGIFQSLVNQRGIVEADTTASSAGSIVLKSNSNGVIKNKGTLSAAGSSTLAGGTVDILAADDVVLGEGIVDVHGAPGGLFTVNALGDVTVDGTRVKGDATVVAFGDIKLGYLEAVNLQTFSNGSIKDINGCRLNVKAANWLASAEGSFEADTLVGNLDVTADSIRVDQQCGDLNLVSAIAREGSLVVTADRNLTVGLALTGGNCLLLAAGGDLVVDTVITSAEGTATLLACRNIVDSNGDLTNIFAKNLSARANGNIDLDTAVEKICAVTSYGNISLDDEDAVSVSASTCRGDVTVTAGGDLTVREISAGGNVTVVASDGNIFLGDIDAQCGRVTATASAAILDINGSQMNIIAQKVYLTAGTGIGTKKDSLEVRAKYISAVSATGGVYISKK